MKFQAQAAILREPAGRMSIEPVVVGEPTENEVLVEIAACGICHTDMVMRDGHLPIPHPVVLGHEGAGHVVAVGSAVTNVKPGDPVIMSFASCGTCPSCVSHDPAYCHEFFPLNFFAKRSDGSTALSSKDQPVHSHIFGQSAFATHAIAPARNVVKAPVDIPLNRLAPLGCGIQTGAGAVLNSLKVQAGSSVLVMGAGAVGMAAIMASRIAGAESIIALDLSQARLDLSRELGATHALLSDGRPITELLRAAGLSGVDYTIDTTGVPALLGQALLALNARGVLGLIAAYPPGITLSAELAFLMSGGRRIQGIVEGSADPQEFIPKLIAYHRSGLLPFDRLIEFFPFSAINEAIEAGESGRVIKPVVTMA